MGGATALLAGDPSGVQVVAMRHALVQVGPAGAVHSVKNVGGGNAAELATYVVETGKPLVEVAT